MARASTIRKRPGPESSSAKSVSDKLRRIRESLRDLQETDENTGEYSVEHCSRMAKYWGAKFLQADSDFSEAEDPAERAQAHSRLLAASKEAGEWEKRKATAMAGKKTDMLIKVLAKLEEQEQLASELMDIEE